MPQIQVITGVERRRRWSDDEKRSIVAAAFSPGAVVTAVARRADVCPSQVYRWRREFATERPGFAEVVVFTDRMPPAPALVEAGVTLIEVDFADRARVRIPPTAPPELAVAIVKALR